MSRTVLLIANPAAGFHDAARRAEIAAVRLGRLGFKAELYRTRGPKDGERAAREASRRFDLVIAAGGDGTLHELANGLAGTQTPLGLIPLGSMNILARELGMPLDVEGACEWIARAEPQPVALGRREQRRDRDDIGKGNPDIPGGQERREDRYFVIMAGIGYDAFALEAAMSRADDAGRKVRFSDYVAAATVGARRYAFPRLVVESEGRSETCAFALLANCARYGANLRIARRALVEEPLLDLVLFSSGRLQDRLRYFAAVLAGRQEHTEGVIYRKVREVTIRGIGSARIPCQLDGERSAPLPGCFRVVPGALLLLRNPRNG